LADSQAVTPPAFPARWKLSDPTLVVETFSSRIWKARREDGSAAIVKALKCFPDVYDELRGAYFLRWRNGVGAVRLLDLDDQTMLLEYGGERVLTAEIEAQGDNAATDIAADVLARMLTPSSVPAPPELQPLRERFASLFAKAHIERQTVGGSVYIEAAELAERLLANPQDVRPLHGDLHHENIILSNRGWLVIDPKGVLGDPAFDAGNMFYNPLELRDTLCLDEHRIAYMAETFGKVLGQSPVAILDHAFAYGCLSACWHAEDANADEESLERGVAKAIRSVRFSF